jgi:non-ribosomal peptide synthetase component F
MGLFRKELAALYEAYTRGLPSPLRGVPVQFADFAAWQRDLLEQGFFDRQISYWLNQLDGPPAKLDFRRDGKNKKSARYHSSRLPVEIDSALFDRIKDFAREQNCTPFIVFIAALNILLYRYTGQHDIRIGTLVANRGQTGTDGVIGYFVNALVLRTSIRAKMNVAEFIKVVRRTCVEAYAHQDLPFEYLEALLDRRRKQRSVPLYQVMLNYRNLSTPPAEINGLTIASWNGKNRAGDPGVAISRLDVNFHLHELPTKLTGAVNFKTDLFDNAAITKLLQNYSKVLGQMVAHPEQRITGMALR